MRRTFLLVALLLCTLLPATVTMAAPAGLKLAFVRDGDLWLLADGRERRLTYGGGVSDPSLSHDGRYVTYSQGMGYAVIGTAGAGPWPITGAAPGRWSPRENTLAVTDGRSVSTVAVTDQGPGAPQLVAEGWTGGPWAPDGHRLAVSRSERSERSMFEGTAHVGVVAASGGHVATILTEKFPLPSADAPVGGAIPTAWSADGRWLLLLRGGLTASMAADANQFAVISVKGGKAYPLGLSPNVRWAAWAPSRGARLAYVDGAGRSAWTNKRLRLAAPPWRREAMTVTPDGYADRDPAWRLDGRALAFTRSRAQPPPNMDLPAPGQSIYRLDLPGKTARSVDGSGDGFCPFWDRGGALYWLKTDAGAATATVHGEHNRIVTSVDLPPTYYGQRQCERILDSAAAATR